LSSSLRAAHDVSPLSLHDALPISRRKFSWTSTRFVLVLVSLGEPAGTLKAPVTRFRWLVPGRNSARSSLCVSVSFCDHQSVNGRSEEHTSELQSRSDLVCRLLLEK